MSAPARDTTSLHAHPLATLLAFLALAVGAALPRPQPPTVLFDALPASGQHADVVLLPGGSAVSLQGPSGHLHGRRVVRLVEVEGEGDRALRGVPKLLVEEVLEDLPCALGAIDLAVAPTASAGAPWALAARCALRLDSGPIETVWLQVGGAGGAAFEPLPVSPRPENRAGGPWLAVGPGVEHASGLWVVWTEETGPGPWRLLARRFGLDGVPGTGAVDLGPADDPLGSRLWALDVAVDPGGGLVIAHSEALGGGGSAVVVRSVTGDGTPGPWIPLAGPLPDAAQVRPAVAVDGAGRVAVAWAERFGRTGEPGTVRLRVLEPEELRRESGSGSPGDGPAHPVVDLRFDRSGHGLHEPRITVLDGGVGDPGAGDGGAGFVVAWRETLPRGGATGRESVLSPGPGPHQLVVQWLGPGGTPRSLPVSVGRPGLDGALGPLHGVAPAAEAPGAVWAWWRTADGAVERRVVLAPAHRSQESSRLR